MASAQYLILIRFWMRRGNVEDLRCSDFSRGMANHGFWGEVPIPQQIHQCYLKGGAHGLTVLRLVHSRFRLGPLKLIFKASLSDNIYSDGWEQAIHTKKIPTATLCPQVSTSCFHTLKKDRIRLQQLTAHCIPLRSLLRFVSVFWR